jgi:hypothetical protein
MIMKITKPVLKLTGLESRQRYVSVSGDTAVFASTTQLRVTGVAEQNAVIEVRKAPSRSFEEFCEPDAEAAWFGISR